MDPAPPFRTPPLNASPGIAPPAAPLPATAPQRTHPPAPVDPERIRANRAAAKSEETKRALKKNWERFAAWCGGQGVASLPAAPDWVEAYLLYLADDHPVLDKAGVELRRGMKPSGVKQALWAIGLAHRLAGLPNPAASEAVRLALAGISRRKGLRTKQQAPLTIAHLHHVPFGGGLKDVRDKALLLVGFAGAFRRSELVTLRAEDIETTRHGLRIHLARSKTDQEARGAWVDIVRAVQHPGLCPVAALQAWLAAAGIERGHLFCAVSKGGRPNRGRPLSGVTVDALVKRAAQAAGLDGRAYGGHSLRAGQATYLAEQGKSPTLIARHGRWKSMDMVLRYVRGDTAEGLVGSY
jgi:integrase